MAHRLEGLGKVVRLGAATAHAGADQAAGIERVVADHFCREPIARRAGEQLVFRVGRLKRGPGVAGLPVGGGHDDLLEQTLDVPVVGHEVGREPVE